MHMLYLKLPLLLLCMTVITCFCVFLALPFLVSFCGIQNKIKKKERKNLFVKLKASSSQVHSKDGNGAYWTKAETTV